MMEARYLWTIENFSFPLNDRVLKSPVFNAANDERTQWRLTMSSLYGVVDEDTDSSIPLYLNLCSSGGKTILATCKMTLLNAEHGHIERTVLRKPCRLREGQFWGKKRFIKKDCLEAKHHVPGGKIHLFCEVSYEVDASSKRDCPAGSIPGKFVLDDLSELYESQMLSDVVLVVDGKEFYAHKAILAARSTGFRAMFGEDCESLKTSRVEISYVDKHTFEDLLRFIYTGEAKDTTTEITRLLAEIGDYAVAKTTSVAGFSDVFPTRVTAHNRPGAAGISTEARARHHVHFAPPANPLRGRRGEGDQDRLETLVKNLLSAIVKYAAGENASVDESHNGDLKSASKIGKRPRAENLTQGKSSDSIENPPSDSTQQPEAMKRFPQDMPLVNMDRFDPKRDKFQRWWREFRELVHDRRDLSISQKFTYLKWLLEGEAVRAIIADDETTSEYVGYVGTLGNLLAQYGYVGTDRSESPSPSPEFSRPIWTTGEDTLTDNPGTDRTRGDVGQTDLTEGAGNSMDSGDETLVVIHNIPVPGWSEENAAHAEASGSGVYREDLDPPPENSSAVPKSAEYGSLTNAEYRSIFASHRNTGDNRSSQTQCPSRTGNHHDAPHSSGSEYSSAVIDD